MEILYEDFLANLPMKSFENLLILFYFINCRPNRAKFIVDDTELWMTPK